MYLEDIFLFLGFHPSRLDLRGVRAMPFTKSRKHCAHYFVHYVLTYLLTYLLRLFNS